MSRHPDDYVDWPAILVVLLMVLVGPGSCVAAAIFAP